ncbi:MAG: bifunctional glutamate N-acetyltransferase/amino-acid acetyltransferase ArgJ [Chthoniobacterales bacterium]
MKKSSRIIGGGVCAPKEFLASAIYAGIKKANKSRNDLALVLSAIPATAAATFTNNKVKAAPVRLSMEHIKSKDAYGVILNSGNANACTGARGMRDARRMTAATAKSLGLEPEHLLIGSTGRIGVFLPMPKIIKAIRDLADETASDQSRAAAVAIMTSDTFPKEYAVEFRLRGKKVRIGGIAKGAGMINPDMATMLCVVTTDAGIPKVLLKKLLDAAVEQSFNRITVDGDMSTNDTVILLANGASGVSNLNLKERALFQAALNTLTLALAKMIVKDGEGVSRFIELEVTGAASAQEARRAGEAIANSMLVKCAWAGGDPNWGRILDAVGYAKVKMREELVDIFYDDDAVAIRGMAAKTSFKKLQKVAAKKEFKVKVNLRMGRGSHSIYTTDLTEEYVRLNLGE